MTLVAPSIGVAGTSLLNGGAILGWGLGIPSGVITNADLEARLDTSDDWIVERTGIRERRVVGEGESTATLAITAGAQAMAHAGLTAADIDLLIIATATPDQQVPSTAAFVQDALGLRCGAFDLGAACSGFAYSLVVASSFLATGAVRHVLVIGSEVITRFLDPADRGTQILFGDGAGAAVIGAAPDGAGLLAWDLGCDGSAATILEVPGGGRSMPATPETVAAGGQYLRMEGREVFRRAVRAVVDSATVTLERAGVTADDVDLFIPHQANARIVDAVLPRIGIPAEKTFMNVERFGNTSAASIPIALAEAADAGLIAEGDLVLLSGFGAGMTWATALLRWSRGAQSS
ncbi:MAG TPA: beta-ketoacyl-ACP synthase III [Acidimicrobiales bacterium]|nr:beta-ketoacyl-ACP synthase III [Acidimicrobiales bacterium]